MKSYLCVSVVVLVAVGLFAAVAPANASCSKFVGTADGWNKADALSGAQSALVQAINQFKASKRINVSVSAMRAKPQPYWRESVSSDLFLKPDVVTARSYTTCWRGVVSPVVCTSGAKVCW